MFESSVPSIDIVVASKVTPAVTSISNIPASMSTIEPAFASPSKWIACPAVCADTNDI